MLLEYLKNNILVTDGAMGTYYSQTTGDYENFCEFANIDKPDVIKEIHKSYIDAGSKLIRTNTFSANSITLEVDKEQLKQIISGAVSIAKDAVKGTNVFIAGSIGPIPELKSSETKIIDEYKFIVDRFLELGINIFMFETFSSIEYLKEIAGYIKQKDNSACIITQFAIMPNEYTREGISIDRIIDGAKDLAAIDIYGFNCGSGPTHLYKMLEDKAIFNDVISVLPNAGYPELVNERMIYVDNPDYFADKLISIKNLGAKIIGGCCGTTPKHIKSVVLKLQQNKSQLHIDSTEKKIEKANIIKKENKFIDKLNNGEFVIAVELDPPFNTEIDKIMDGARICKENGIDLITIADSPMSKVRVDSIMMASKIQREFDIETMPHICCRDKNINALRSGILAAHIEGIRNILAVTGDPVSSAEKQDVKKVFNLNSYKLIELISGMNKEVFLNDDVSIGGALNLNVLNKEHEVSRMEQKIEKGATFFLTQPIYDEKTIEFLSKMKKDKNIKILAGILPIVSYRNAQFLNNELPGVHIPKEYVDRFTIDMSKEEAEQVGIDIAVEIAEKFINYVDGIYIMPPFNRVQMVMKIVKRIQTLRFA